ncbi:MAG TPA: GIY-YIG nuclease family protein [Patescibacteria group bacterium]|nr:GIY-YIG nuclease family protein [Patescibacteria group bacterium]
MKNYYIYILTNWNNKVLYTGVTNNLLRRTGEHKLKMLNGFTKKYNLNKLVYFEEFRYVGDAIAAEKKIKGWIRSKKNKLVESINPNWDDLFNEVQFNIGSGGIAKDPSLRSG